MGKRKVDPTTGESRLTHREERLVDELIKNGGNGARAAAAAGYGSARADQSAYQVLQRPEVQRRIRQRIAESRVSADEIIGTLASFMRGTLADFLDESGSFSIEAAKERGVDHLLKSITTATREIQATKNAPAQTVRTCRGQLYSPIQAAIALARILGIDRNGGRRSRSRASYSDQDEFRSALSADFNVGSWLEDLIQQQMNEQGLARDTVVESLLRVRPEIAKYLRELPDPRKAARDSRTTATATRPAPILDFIAALAADPHASPGSDPAAESALLIQTLSSALNIGSITPEAFQQAIDRIIERLSEEQRRHLDNILQLEAIFLDAMAASDPTRPAPPKHGLADSSFNQADLFESGRPVQSEPTTSDLTHPDPTDPGLTDSDHKGSDLTQHRAVHSRLEEPDSLPPNLQPATCNMKLPPGLERYIHPTDYLTPIPDTWPPTRNPWPQTANQCPPVTDQQAAGARSRHYKNSQSFSMSSPHYAGPPPPPDFAPSDMEGDDEDDECENSPSFSMSGSSRLP